MIMLDKSRCYGILGCGQMKFFSQDNKAFDMGTLEEVDLSTLPKEKPKAPPVLTCKLCGAKRQTPELIKEHLLAMHRDVMEKAKKAVPKPEEPKAGPEGSSLKELTKEVRDMKKATDDDKSVMLTVDSALHHKEPAQKRGRGRPKKVK